jgi:hypothetical protein
MKNAQSLMSYADYGMFPLCCCSLAVVRWRIPRVLGNRRNVLRSLSAMRWSPKHRPMIISKSLLLADRKSVHESRFARNEFSPTGLCLDRRLFFFQYPVMKFRESCCKRHPDFIFSQIQDYYRSFPRKWLFLWSPRVARRTASSQSESPAVLITVKAKNGCSGSV